MPLKGIDDSESEAERRRKVAEEKMMGAIIELLERRRKRPVAHSIIQRLVHLYEDVYAFHKTVKAIGVTVGPFRTATPSTKEQTNILIKTYNSIIKDLHSHLAKKDSYITEFSPFEGLDEPTIDEVSKTLFMMGTNISQIFRYMLRWME